MTSASENEGEKERNRTLLTAENLVVFFFNKSEKASPIHDTRDLDIPDLYRATNLRMRAALFPLSDDVMMMVKSSRPNVS